MQFIRQGCRGHSLGPNRVTPIAVSVVCISLAGACTGGSHRRGDHQVTVLGSYDDPTKSGIGLWSAADGRSENAGVAVGYNYFVADRFSVGAAVTPYRFYNQSDGDTFAGEFQLALRYYFLDFDLGDRGGSEYEAKNQKTLSAAQRDKSSVGSQPSPKATDASAVPRVEQDFRPNVGLFVELMGGMMHSRRSVPEDGTRTNWTQDTGVGMEVRLTEHVSWISGYRLRHFSNCQAFGKDNPAQNDQQVYTGIGFSW